MELVVTAPQVIIAKVEQHQVQQVSITPEATIGAELPEEVIEQKIRLKFGKYAESALKIANCESKGENEYGIFQKYRSLAMNEDGIVDMSYGVFQINLIPPLNLTRPSKQWLLNADNNIEYAYMMSGGGTNWQPWSCSKII